MKKGTLFIISGLLLVATALGLTAFNIYDANRAEENANAVVNELVQQINETTTTENAEVLPDYVLYPEMEMPTIIIDGERYIGYIEIPDLDIILPVADECTDAKLKNTPCWYEGSVYQDNMIIAAHNYAKHFGKLKNLPQGSLVRFTDAAGNVFEYTIGWMETVDKSDAEAMLSGDDWDLTLFTCTYGGAKRYTFRCIKTIE